MRLVLGPGVTAAISTIALIAGAVRMLGGGPALGRAGPAALAVAVLIGVPHGALDTDLVVARRQPQQRVPVLRLAAGTAYLGAAASTWLAWRAAPAVALLALLAVAAAHFAVADWSTERWRQGQSSRLCWLHACATGVLAVAGPFALWPAATAPALASLHAADEARPLTTAARLAFAGAVAIALVAAPRWWRCNERSQALAPFALVGLTAACPPLPAFAVYFAGWHCLRQSARLLALHPDAHATCSQAGTLAGIRFLAARSAVPTVMALAVLVLWVRHPGDATADVIVALLSITVPHAAVTAWREIRPMPSPASSAES